MIDLYEENWFLYVTLPGLQPFSVDKYCTARVLKNGSWYIDILASYAVEEMPLYPFLTAILIIIYMFKVQMDDDDDIPTLSADTFAALQEFYAEQEKRQDIFDKLRAQDQLKENILFDENWVIMF